MNSAVSSSLIKNKKNSTKTLVKNKPPKGVCLISAITKESLFGKKQISNRIGVNSIRTNSVSSLNTSKNFKQEKNLDEKEKEKFSNKLKKTNMTLKITRDNHSNKNNSNGQIQNNLFDSNKKRTYEKIVKRENKKEEKINFDFDSHIDTNNFYATKSLYRGDSKSILELDNMVTTPVKKSTENIEIKYDYDLKNEIKINKNAIKDEINEKDIYTLTQSSDKEKLVPLYVKETNIQQNKYIMSKIHEYNTLEENENENIYLYEINKNHDPQKLQYQNLSCENGMKNKIKNNNSDFLNFNNDIFVKDEIFKMTTNSFSNLDPDYVLYLSFLSISNIKSLKQIPKFRIILLDALHLKYEILIKSFEYTYKDLINVEGFGFEIESIKDKNSINLNIRFRLHNKDNDKLKLLINNCIILRFYHYYKKDLKIGKGISINRLCNIINSSLLRLTWMFDIISDKDKILWINSELQDVSKLLFSLKMKIYDITINNPLVKFQLINLCRLKLNLLVFREFYAPIILSGKNHI